MKKTYLTPELEVVKIATARVLAGSDPNKLYNTENNDDKGNPDYSLSRTFGFGDDEE